MSKQGAFTKKTTNHKGPELAKRRRAMKITPERARRDSGLHYKTFRALESGSAVQVAAVGRYSKFIKREEALRSTTPAKPLLTKRLLAKRSHIPKKVTRRPVNIRIKGEETVTVDGNKVTIGDRITLEIGK